MPGKPLTLSQVLVPVHLSTSTPHLHTTHLLGYLPPVRNIMGFLPQIVTPWCHFSHFPCHPVTRVELVLDTRACGRAQGSVSGTNPAVPRKRLCALPTESCVRQPWQRFKFYPLWRVHLGNVDFCKCAHLSGLSEGALDGSFSGCQMLFP